MKDSGTRDLTFMGRQASACSLSTISGVLDIGQVIPLFPPIVETKYPLAQSLWPRKLRALRSTFCAIQVELFSFRYPITSSTDFHRVQIVVIL